MKLATQTHWAVFAAAVPAWILFAMSTPVWATQAEAPQNENQGLDLATGGQSRQSLANDQSATQWTFIVGHQWMDFAFGFE